MKLHFKSALFSSDNCRTSRLSSFYRIQTVETSSQNILITFLWILLKLHKRRGGYWKKKLPWTILEEQFPLPRNTAASKISNSVILIAMTTPMSVLSNIAMVVIFIEFLLIATKFKLKLGRYWLWKTLLSHLIANLEQKQICNRKSSWPSSVIYECCLLTEYFVYGHSLLTVFLIILQL